MQNNTTYTAGLYLRLSKDDEQAGESVSISTQRAILLDFCQQEGHAIHEITARKFVTQKTPLGKSSKKWFINWCKANGFQFDSITFCSEKNGPQDKYEACVKYGVEVMVDDRPEIVLYLADRGIPVLMVDAPYNQKVKHPNVTRVHGWLEVYEMIREMG